MADTLESLEIEVKHSASGAAGEISGVANAIHDLGNQLLKVLPDMKELSAVLSKVKGNININIRGAESAGKVSGAIDPQHSSSGNPSQWAREMTNAIESNDKGFSQNANEIFDTEGINSAKEAIANAMQYAKEVVSKAVGYMSADLSKVPNALQMAGNGISNAFHSIGAAVRGAVGKANRGFSNISKAISGIKESAKSALKSISSLMSSLGRIAFYRIIRGMIKAVTQAFKEGLEYAYAFSSGMTNESHRFAEALDSMKSASGQMKGQLGAAFAALLAAIQPIIETLINLVIRAANAISQLLSAFTGTRYLKAAAVTEQFADNMKKGAGAAKEWKNQLLGFDELNRLNEPSSGGGGSSAEIDPMSRFTDEAIDSRIKQFVDDLKKSINDGDWAGVGQLIGEKINSIFPKESKWSEWGSKLGYGINGAVQTVHNTLKSIDFVAIGRDLASFINGIFDQVDFSYIGALWADKFTVQLDFFMGFLGSLNWKSIGKGIGDLFRGALDEASSWLASKDWSEMGSNVFKKFKDLIEGIDFNTLADSFFTFLGTAFGAAVQFLDGFLSGTITAIKDYFRQKTEEAGGDAWEGFKKGITDALSNVWQWCKEHIVDPFVNAVKDLLGIHSPSTVFADIGGNIVSGLQSGIAGAWGAFETWFGNIFSNLISWCQSAHYWIQDVLNGIGLVNSAQVGSQWNSGGGFAGRSGRFADGGYPESGQLFFAREDGAGAELVGTVGGRTAVASNDDILSGIRQGVFEAVSAAMNGSASNGGDVNVRVYLDSREIKSGQRRLGMATGV